MPDTSIDRRAALLAASGVVLAGGRAAAQSSGDKSVVTGARETKTFLFIHGAYHGGWCWQLVTPLIERHGHKVYAPSLTGNADRSHLLTKDVNLDTQILDIVNLVKWEDLKNFCLVVHSFGGWPSSGALEQIHDRVASIVWVDAFMPKNGERPLDTLSPFSRKALEEAMARGEAGRAPPPAKTYSQDESRFAWIDSKLSPQPNGVAFQAITLTGKLQTVPKKTYVRVPSYRQDALDAALAACQADKTWQTFVKENSGHDVMIDQPEWLAELILKVS
jgi:pimeloyl-ACP methyl ester carboxylesterase